METPCPAVSGSMNLHLADDLTRLLRAFLLSLLLGGVLAAQTILRIPIDPDTCSDLIRTAKRKTSDRVPISVGQFLGAKRRFGSSVSPLEFVGQVAVSPLPQVRGVLMESEGRIPVPNGSSAAADRSPVPRSRSAA